jgi:hypothetical protein
MNNEGEREVVELSITTKVRRARSRKGNKEEGSKKGERGREKKG